MTWLGVDDVDIAFRNLKKLTSASSSSAVSNDKSNQTAGGGSTVGAPHGPDADGEGESGVNKLSEDLEHVHALVTKALERYRENTRRVSTGKEARSLLFWRLSAVYESFLWRVWHIIWHIILYPAKSAHWRGRSLSLVVLLTLVVVSAYRVCTSSSTSIERAVLIT